MDLYVVRHGEAAPDASGGDAARPLTTRGAREVAAVGRGLHALGVVVDALCASPLRRAQETAQILARQLGGPEPATHDALDGHTTAAALLREVAEWARGARCIAIVGHQPVLGELIEMASAGIGGAGVALPPGGVALLSFAGAPRAGGAKLVWLLPPAVLTHVEE